MEELESLLGPEDSEVDFTRILEETRNKQGRAIVSRARWDEHQRKLGTQKEESKRRAQEVEELVENEGEMCYESSPVKASPNDRRRRTPLTLQQNSSSSANERHWQADREEQRSIGAVNRCKEDYLERCSNIKVEIAALEL